MSDLRLTSAQRSALYAAAGHDLRVGWGGWSFRTLDSLARRKFLRRSGSWFVLTDVGRDALAGRKNVDLDEIEPLLSGPCLVCDDPEHSADECPNGDGTDG